jgi:ssDNA-binding replication factor A large subunit
MLPSPYCVFQRQKDGLCVFNKHAQKLPGCKKLFSFKRPLSCRRKMTYQELIAEIQRQNPLISEQQIQQRLEAERAKCGGLLGDETLLRLVAAKLGVKVQQNSFHNNGVMSIGRLIAGLNDVTVSGRLIAVFPVKTFQGEEKSGKFATVMLADDEGILRVMLWDERVELLEKGELKANQTVRLLHGYTKEDRSGKVELHLGRKSQIQIEPPEKASSCPAIEKFATKIGTLTLASGNVIVCGIVKAVFGKKNFARDTLSEGTVMRLSLADESGQVTVVAWNEKAGELDNLKENERLLIVNARVKEAQNSVIEVHVDSNTAVNVLKS